MTNDSIEQQLQQLGNEWLADETFVDDVMSRADSEPQRPSTPEGSGRRIRRISFVVIGALIACLGLWWGSGTQSTGSVLYAQVKEALSQVQSIHQVVSVQTNEDDLHQVSETWFARGQGFAVIREDLIRIDNGTYFWNHRPGSGTASRTKSMGTDALLDQALNIREELERQCERFAEGDRSIDRVEHACYRLTFHGPGQPADLSVLDFDKRRTLIFIDPKTLPTRIESQEQVDGKWKTTVVRTWEYDAPIDPTVFQPNFGDGVRVIDTDTAFERLTNVENSVHTEQRDGLIYTIHQAKRFKNGGLMIMSSVRGTDETLRKYPLTRRRIQPGLYITDGPATNHNASRQGSGHFRLSLAKANHQGIDVEWRMIVPRGRQQTPHRLEDQDGRVLLELGIIPRGEYAKANHIDKYGVIHGISWKLPLQVPQPDRLPSLSEMTDGVHAHLSLLGPAFAKHLCMGIDVLDDVPTQKFGSTDEVSREQFATATREHLQWWGQRDIAFQLKNGRTNNDDEIGAIFGTRAAVVVNYYPGVDDTTLSLVAKRSNLYLLSVRGTNITDAGLVHLTTLKKLEQLDIGETAVTDKGLRHLEKMKSLRKVNLTDTKVTQNGIDQLRKALLDAVIIANDEDTNHGSAPRAHQLDDDTVSLPPEVSGVVVDLDDEPVAHAKVTVSIRRFSEGNDKQSDGPGPWLAVTDEKGRYFISPTGTVRPNHDDVRIRVLAEGLADVSGTDDKKKILKGTLPRVRMLPGRRITGRLVDQEGTPAAQAIVRIWSCSATLTVWGSAPIPVDTDGSFSLSIPSDGKAAATVYPTGFAPRFVDVTDDTNQGDILLEKGILRRGRVVDRNGKGVARTAVEIRHTQIRHLHAFGAVIGTAVRTDEAGYFQLPSLLGTYKLSVGESVPDFSGGGMMTGEPPPAIKSVTIEFGASLPDRLILLQE